MKRREFSAAAAAAALVAAGTAGLGAPGLALAQGAPQEGTHYRGLDKHALVEAPAGKIEVVEFFWYGCPHCNAFEPRFSAWTKLQPADVAVRRVPVAFRDGFVPLQRLFYTLEAMGKLEELHPKVFAAIHNEHQVLDREDRIAAFAEKNGLDRARFQELYNSFSVSAKARRASQLQEAYQVEGVPALGVAGRYYTDTTMAGGMGRALQVLDYLIGQARQRA